MILIEPQWNVDAETKAIETTKGIILIEPQWNVDVDNDGNINIDILILIEPQWNVDEYSIEEVKSELGHFNRTIVECRFIMNYASRLSEIEF